MTDPRTVIRERFIKPFLARMVAAMVERDTLDAKQIEVLEWLSLRKSCGLNFFSPLNSADALKELKQQGMIVGSGNATDKYSITDKGIEALSHK